MLLEKDKTVSRFYIFVFCLSLVVAVIIPFAVLSLTLIAGLLATFVAVTAALVLFQQPSRSVFVFIFFLPVHSLIMTVLIAQVGLPLTYVRIIAAWKESLLFLTISVVILRVIIRQRLTVLNWVDWIALLWLSQIFLYFLIGSLTPNWQPSLIARLYGARDWLLYLAPYFIGRLITLSDRNAQRVLNAILLVSLITSLYGIFEYFLLPIEFHVELGVPRYFRDFLNLSYPDYLLGLPPNYWAEVAGQPVRRSVSTYLSGQGFAIPFLLLIPIILAQYCYRPTKKNLLVVSMGAFALLLTITRMTIIICFMQGLIILFLMHRYKLLVRILLLGSILFLIVLIVNSNMRMFVFDTLLLRDTSSSARPEQWMRGIQTILDIPFGAGLGFAGQVGARFGGGGGGQEAGYFKITGDLGIPGLLFFLLWFWGILLFSLNLYRTSVNVWKIISLSTFVTTLGFLLNNLTAPPDQSLFLIYIFPFLAGITIRRSIVQRIARLKKQQMALKPSSYIEQINETNIEVLNPL